MTFSRIVFCGIVLVATSGQAQERAILSVRSQLVQLYMTVTEGNRAVPDLTAADFSISEDGHVKQIEKLESGKNPLQIALLFDISESMRGALPVTKEAAARFVQSLEPADRVTLVSFNSEIRYLPQRADDRTQLVQAIRNLQSRGDTKLYEAVLFAMKYLGGQDGRKAIVIFSDGEDTALSTSLELVLNAAARYGYPIYTIGAGSGREKDNLKQVLRRLAEVNSGKTYFVENPDRLQTAFLEVASELRTAYVLNYYTDVPPDGRWHGIEVRVSNSRYKVQTRKGFYAESPGSASLFASSRPSERPALPSVNGTPRAWTDDELTAQAVNKILEPAPDVRVLDALGAPAEQKQSPAAVFKVETHFVEVPVLLEYDTNQKVTELSEKDFRVYEDDVLQKIAFFGKADDPSNFARLRDSALKKIGTGGAPSGVDTAPAAEMDTLVLGRVYLVLDDMMTEPGPFLQAKAAAEKILRSSSPVRPLMLCLTSDPQIQISAGSDLGAALSKVRNAASRAGRDLTGSSMTPYQAQLIERGDAFARQISELQAASDMGLSFQNSLGSTEGDMKADPNSIASDVESRSHEIVAQYFGQIQRVLTALRNVVGAAAAETGSYSKTVIFLSSGFLTSHNSVLGDASAGMEAIVRTAKRAGVRIYAIDATGLEATQPLDMAGSGAVLARNPQLISILEDQARGSRQQRESALNQLASETAGRFVHGTNDLTGALGSTIRNAGQLYYLGILSQQPVGGYHSIRVSVSARSAIVHSRTRYYAGARAGSDTPGDAALLGTEDWQAVISQANAAREAGNNIELAVNLERLARRFPDDANIWYNLGVAQLRLKNPQQAVEALQKAFALSSEDKGIGIVLARAFVAAGFRDAAVDALEIVLRRNSNDIAVLNELGLAYESTSQILEAYGTYRKVLDLTSTPPLDMYLSLIRTSIRLERTTEAKLFMDDYLSRGGSRAAIAPYEPLLRN